MKKPIQKQEHLLPLHTYVFAIYTYKRVPSTTLSLWPQKSSRECTREVVLFADIVQVESEEEAFKEGMEHYRHFVLPHLHNRPEPLGAWRQHLGKYENNFYPEAVRIYDYEIRENGAAMIRDWAKHAQAGLLEKKQVIDRMRYSHA